MKNKFYIFLFFLLGGSFLFGISNVEADKYYVKAYDMFVLQTITPDTLNVETPVLPSGELSLYPLAKTIDVAGLTLKEAKTKIYETLNKSYNRDMFSVELLKIAPISFHINGAVGMPGEYFSEEPITLYQSLVLAGNTLSRASDKVKIMRHGKKVIYDLHKYLSEGDLSQNPMLQNDDVILVDFAEKFVSYMAFTDTSSAIQYIEFQDDMRVVDLYKRPEINPLITNYDDVMIFRNEQLIPATMNTELEAFDEIRTSSREQFIFVTGYVRNPGMFHYEANKDVYFYIHRARGTMTNSAKKVFLIHADGSKEKYKGQTLEPGDTIHVPEHWLMYVKEYAVPFATIVSFSYSFIRILEIFEKI